MATKDNIPAIPSMRFQILAGYQRYRRPAHAGHAGHERLRHSGTAWWQPHASDASGSVAWWQPHDGYVWVCIGTYLSLHLRVSRPAGPGLSLS